MEIKTGLVFTRIRKCSLNRSLPFSVKGLVQEGIINVFLTPQPAVMGTALMVTLLKLIIVMVKLNLSETTSIR